MDRNVYFFEPEEEEAHLTERCFELCVEKGKACGKSDAEVASELVEKWMLEHKYRICEGTTIHIIVAAVEAAGLGDKSSQYLEVNYWAKYFADPNYTEMFWNELFKEEDFQDCHKVSLKISNLIPDDPIHRMVLHFLRGWGRRLHSYILDEEIPVEERLLVLKKQVENFVFFSRKKPFGGLWKMYSEPNDMIRQALGVPGMAVPLHDDKENPVSTITGNKVLVQVDENTPKSAGDSPRPDDHDKKIYSYIRRFAVKKLGEDKVHNSWTMVKSSFHHKLNSKNTRCYAFSGHGQSKKELHNMPSEWWEKCSGKDAWEDDQEINFTNVDNSQFGQHLVLSLFHALSTFIEEDLKKLALLIAFGELSLAESVISESRRDMGVLDYGEFFDFVMAFVNDYDKKIDTAITNVLKHCKDTTSAVDYNCIRPYVQVRPENKQFAPNKEKIKDCLSMCYSNVETVDKNCDILCKISHKLLRELQEKLNELPKKFLSHLVKQLQESKCGEDNVIRLTLRELCLLNCNSFLQVQVKFVKMDANSMNDGKPFCEVCARKVRFYSVLPELLRAIGSTGEDFDQLAPLFAKLRYNF